MIIWLNGAFGSGKTQTACELQRRLPEAYLYDPEEMGFFIGRHLPKAALQRDFQDYRMWREFNVQMIEYICEHYSGHVIVPMTITDSGYYREMVERLAAAHELRHFILYADRDVLLKRLASAVSAYTYGKNRNLDIRNGLIMMVAVLVFTVVGSLVASLVPAATMGNFLVFMTFLLGIRFLLRPVMTTKDAMQDIPAKKRAIQSLLCGMIIGFICGFIGAGGGMMMLLLLTSVLGYELKTAVGTSVFIMTFTALTGAVSHFVIGGAPDWPVFLLCVLFTLLWARIAAVIANRATGVILVVLGLVVMGFTALT